MSGEPEPPERGPMPHRLMVRRPVLCAVTDRRQLGVGEGEASLDALIAQVNEAAGAGIDLVQIREPDLPAVRLVRLVSRAVQTVEGSQTLVIVNDRLDVALAAGAHGVHLKSASFAPARVRAAVPPDFLIGRSVHGAAEAAEAAAEAGAGGLDYLIMGTIFPSLSKPAGHRLAGPEALREAVRASRLPVLAIGGVTLDRIPEIARTGAAGIAAIGLFLGSRSPGAAAGRRLHELAEQIRAAFHPTEP